jgi:nitroreductase/NAD-dependent dihydropyrimidine dehydrogenase PreA subunit
MSLITIDPEKCKRDEICVHACPTLVLQMPSPGEIPESSSGFEAHCLNCGHCVAICPTAAFSLPWLAPEDCPPFDKELVVTPEQGEQFLRQRRSIRTFKDKPVEREKLEKLFQMASFAPTGGNSQLLNWTVVEDTAEVKKMAGLVVEWMRSVMKRDTEMAEAWGLPITVEGWDNGIEDICRGAPHVVVVHGDKNWPFGAEDAAIAITYLQLYAPLLGLGTCWGGYFYSAVNFYPPLFDALGLPADHRAFGAVMVGYPQFRYQRLPKRNEPKVTWR